MFPRQLHSISELKCWDIVPLRKLHRVQRNSVVLMYSFLKAFHKEKYCHILYVGVGIAEKIQEMMKSVFGDCGLDFITMDYKKLIRVLDENDEKSFEQTLLILTTSSLSEGVKTPWLSMYDVLDGSGEQVLWDSLKTVINPGGLKCSKRICKVFLNGRYRKPSAVFEPCGCSSGSRTDFDAV